MIPDPYGLILAGVARMAAPDQYAIWREALARQAAADRLHTIPDPMTARERAERADLAGENG